MSIPGFPPSPSPSKSDKFEGRPTDIAHPDIKPISSNQQVRGKLVPQIVQGVEAINKIKEKGNDPVGAILGRKTTPPAPAAQTLEALAATAPATPAATAAKEALELINKYQGFIQGIAKETQRKTTVDIFKIHPLVTSQKRLGYVDEAKKVEETGKELNTQYDKDQALSLRQLDSLYGNKEFYDALTATGLFQPGDLVDPSIPANQAARNGANTLESKHKKLITDAYEAQKTAAKKEFDALVKENLEIDEKKRQNELTRHLFTKLGLTMDPDEFPMPPVGTIPDEELLERFGKILDRQLVVEMKAGLFGTSLGSKSIVLVDGNPTFPILAINEERAQLIFDLWRRNNPTRKDVTLSISHKYSDTETSRDEVEKLLILAKTYARAGIKVKVSPPDLFSANDWKAIQKASEETLKAAIVRDREEAKNVALDAGVQTRLINAEKDLLDQQQVVENSKNQLQATYDRYITNRPGTALTRNEEQELLSCFAAYQSAQEQFTSNLIAHQTLISVNHSQLNIVVPGMSYDQRDSWIKMETDAGNVNEKCVTEQKNTLDSTLSWTNNALANLAAGANPAIRGALTATMHHIADRSQGQLEANRKLQATVTNKLKPDLAADEQKLQPMQPGSPSMRRY